MKVYERRYLLLYSIYLIINTVTRFTMLNPLEGYDGSEIFNQINLVSSIVVGFFLILNFLFEENTLQEILQNMLLVIFILFLYMISGRSTDLLIIMLMIQFSYRVRFSYIMKYDFYVRLFLFCVILLLHFTSILPADILNIRDGKIRYSLGFQHANILGFFIVILFYSGTYFFYLKYREKFKIYIIPIAIITTLLVNYITSSRGSAISMIVFIILYSVWYIWSDVYKKSFIKYLFIMIPMFYFLISFLLVYNYNSSNQLHYYINKLLSGRIYLISEVYRMYPPKLISQVIPIIGNPNEAAIFGQSIYWIDNIYMWVLLLKGKIFTLFFIGYLIVNMSILQKKQFSIMLIIFTSMLASGMVEAQNLNFYAIFPMLALGLLNTRLNDNRESNLYRRI